MSLHHLIDLAFKLDHVDLKLLDLLLTPFDMLLQMPVPLSLNLQVLLQHQDLRRLLGLLLQRHQLLIHQVPLVNDLVELSLKNVEIVQVAGDYALFDVFYFLGVLFGERGGGSGGGRGLVGDGGELLLGLEEAVVQAMGGEVEGADLVL